MPIPSSRSLQSANRQKYTCGNPLYQWHLRAFHKSLYQLLEQTDARLVLDAGCGEGFVTHFMAQQNPDLSITGVDLRVFLRFETRIQTLDKAEVSTYPWAPSWVRMRLQSPSDERTKTGSRKFSRR